MHTVLYGTVQSTTVGDLKKVLKILGFLNGTTMIASHSSSKAKSSLKKRSLTTNTIWRTRQSMAGTARPPTLTPRELFPWLSAGVSLQLHRSFGGAGGKSAAAAGDENAGTSTVSKGNGIVDPVFLIVSDKAKTTVAYH